MSGAPFWGRTGADVGYASYIATQPNVSRDTVCSIGRLYSWSIGRTGFGFNLAYSISHRRLIWLFIWSLKNASGAVVLLI
jgi:hypothetical protein